MGQLSKSLHISKLLRFFMAAFLLSAIAWQSVAVHAQGPASKEESAPEQTNFDIVVRLSEQLFQASDQAVSRVAHVQPVIVDVLNVGTARVTGELTPDFRPKQGGISMDLVFSGTSVSHTIGRRRSARIHSVSTNRVHVQTPITFDVENGFGVGPSTAKARLVSACRSARTHMRGLRGMIVRNVARRRLCEKRHQIDVETAAAARTRISDTCHDDVQKRVDSWNSRWTPLHDIIITQPWYPRTQIVHYASTDDNLILFIEGNPMTTDGTRSHGRIFPVPAEELPQPKAGGLVDVIFYGEPEQKAVLDAILTLVETTIHEYASDQPIAEKVSFDISAGKGWSMLSVSKDQLSD